MLSPVHGASLCIPCSSRSNPCPSPHMVRMRIATCPQQNVTLGNMHHSGDNTFVLLDST